jgi:AcrR family transcriptional regulator
MLLRDIARKAEVSLPTSLRHFPTREALLDALLRTRLKELTHLADVLMTSSSAEAALMSRI